MSLNFNFERIADYKTACWMKATVHPMTGDPVSFDPKAKGPKRDVVRPALNYLIWNSIAVGLNDLNAKNAADWLKRLKALAKVDGLIYSFPDGYTGPDADQLKGGVPTAELLAKFYGLSTNATKYTDAQFVKGVGRALGFK